MDFHGYGDPRRRLPPEELPQGQNSDSYLDPGSILHHRHPHHEYPPAQGHSLWHHHESGDYPQPFPSHSSQSSSYITPFSSFGDTVLHHQHHGSSHPSSFGETVQHHQHHGSSHPTSYAENAQYFHHLTSGEYSQTEFHSVSQHQDHFKVSYFEDQGGGSSMQGCDYASFHRSSLPHHLSSGEEEWGAAPEQEAVALPKGQLVRIFCRYSRNFNLAVEDNRVVMMEASTENEFQQWIRDDRYSVRVRDNYGNPAFMLINKGSKKALKHGPGQLEEVQLTEYSPGLQDDDLFWTQSRDLVEGFKTVQKASDTLLNLSVSCGNSIENGCALILDTWHKTDNQLWKIYPL